MRIVSSFDFPCEVWASLHLSKLFQVVSCALVVSTRRRLFQVSEIVNRNVLSKTANLYLV
jgi:hypothetical protein